jgi:hypothetical protein
MHMEARMKPTPKPTVTLRNLPPELLQAIRRRAREQKTSLTKAAVGLLEEGAGTAQASSGRNLYHDLDGFAGRWSRDEAAVFEAGLKSQRKVDDEVWA